MMMITPPRDRKTYSVFRILILSFSVYILVYTPGYTTIRDLQRYILFSLLNLFNQAKMNYTAVFIVLSAEENRSFQFLLLRTIIVLRIQ